MNTQELGLVVNNKKVVVSSRKVAEVFGKRHADVLRAIEQLEIPNEIKEHNFVPVEIIEKSPGGAWINKSYYNLTRDGFTLLAMGFTGKRAMEFKLKYIQAFNEMEAALKQNSIKVPETVPELFAFMTAVVGVTEKEVKRIYTKIDENVYELNQQKKELAALKTKIAGYAQDLTITPDQYEQLRALAKEVTMIAGKERTHEYWKMLYAINKRPSKFLLAKSFPLALKKAQAFVGRLRYE